MDTLDTIVELAKFAGILIGTSVAITIPLTCAAAGIIEYVDRRCLVKKLMPLYKNGTLDTKPTTSNIYQILKPVEDKEQD